MEKSLQYSDVERYILDVPRFTTKSSPAETRLFYEKLGEPGSGQNIIHVAGTNGKGSVCSYLSQLLLECGFSVGMFTSPHLISMTERIRINGRSVQEQTFVNAFVRIEAVIKETGHHPTFFELLFFMAMIIFAESGTDYIILETGLGGRLDATNCIRNPLVSVITSIGLDHTEYLGETLQDIAAEKAGIIKKGCPVVCLHGKPAVYQVIARQAKLQNSPIFAVHDKDINILGNREKAIDFSYKSRYYDYIRLFVSTSAVYQVENAALAIRAAEVCLTKAVLTPERIYTAVSKAQWEGRMEEILRQVYVDGAHNEDGIAALLQSLNRDGWTGKRTLLFSAVKDKRYEAMLLALLQSGLFQKVAIAALNMQRAATKEELSSVLEHFGYTYRWFDNVETAFTELTREKEDQERIYAVGSLYLVGQIEAIVKRNGL